MKLLTSLLFSCIIFFYAPDLDGQNGLVAHWSFDTIVDNQFKDHVTNEVAGTLYRVQSIQGQIGKALLFNGSDSYARVPANGEEPPFQIRKLSKGSVSLWFRVDYIPTDYGIAPIFYYGRNTACDFFDAANEGLIFEVGHSPIHNGSRRLYFTTWKNGCTYPSFCYDSWNPIIEGEWYHYVAIVGDSYNTGYLNGEEMDDRKYNFGDPTTHEFFADARAHETLWLGRGYWNTDAMYFDGAIDEIRIFDRPLTPAEVDSLFNEGENPVTDLPGNGYDITNITVFPNPATETIHMEFSQEVIDVTFRVYDNVGNVVYQVEIAETNRISSVDISELPEGLYIYSILNESGILKKGKLIVR